jgi:MerR family redox-sensitive transcriptional activator SoxR
MVPAALSVLRRLSLFETDLAIGAVAERAGIAVSAIRFYEDKGLISSTRNDGGQRRFTRDVLRRLAFIQVAQRVGLSLDEIGNALEHLPEHGGPSGHEWAELSSAWRPMLDERIRLLEALRDQLDTCIGCGCLSLEKCRLRNPYDRAAERGSGPRYLMGDKPVA